MTLSESVCRARWVETEVVHLKRMGLSFEAIADRITAVGLRKATPMVAIPPGVNFPPDYSITKQACHKAFSKAIAREPALGVEELPKIDHQRTEEMWMNLQPAIRKGNPRAMEVGVKVLNHAEKVNGYAAPRRSAPLDEQDDRISIAALRRIIGDNDDLIIAPSHPQRLLTSVGEVPNSDGSTASGVAASVGDNSALQDDGTRLPEVIEWSEVEIVREILAEEEELRTYLYFI